MVQSETSGFVAESGHQRRLFFTMTAVVTCCWFLVTCISRQPGQWALLQFLVVSALMVVAAAFVICRFHRTGQTIPFTWVLVTAVLLRLISLSGEPLFEDDYFRYLWDGYQTVLTRDPYSLAPAAFFDRDVPEIFEPVLSLINYPAIATVYGPVLQGIFGLSYLLDAAQVWPLQLFAGVADIAVLILLRRMGAGNALLLYAWSPLVLKEFSLTAHPDIFAILAVLISIFAAFKNRIALAGLALGLGFGAKVFAILALPYLLSRRWSVGYWCTLVVSFIMTLAATTLYFGTVSIWVPEGLRAMADSWLFNAGAYLALLKLFSVQTTKLLLLSSFSMYVLIVCSRRAYGAWRSDRHGGGTGNPTPNTGQWNESDDAFRGDWLFLFFLLAIPVLNAWYIPWLLVFATLFPRWWSWAISYFCLWSYWNGAAIGEVGDGTLWLSPTIVAMEYLAIIAVTLLAWIVSRNKPLYREFGGA